jgi:hypothetical protein
MGFIMAYCSPSGKTLELRYALQMRFKEEIIYGELNFMIRFEISSYPYVILGFRDLIILSVSLVEAYCQFILAKGLL